MGTCVYVWCCRERGEGVDALQNLLTLFAAPLPPSQTCRIDQLTALSRSQLIPFLSLHSSTHTSKCDAICLTQLSSLTCTAACPSCAPHSLQGTSEQSQHTSCHHTHPAMVLFFGKCVHKKKREGQEFKHINSQGASHAVTHTLRFDLKSVIALHTIFVWQR
jgi:hypothetical protein